MVKYVAYMKTKVKKAQKKPLAKREVALKRPLIGFIGQGYIGKNYSDDFEKRGYAVTRYSLEPQHQKNKEKLKDCDIVFIAVPTPTTPKGFDDSIVRRSVGFVGKGKIAVIKSTIVPGTVRSIQKQYPDILVLNSPEFLSEATAARDASRPFSNIVGIPEKNALYEKAAAKVHSVLPKAPYALTCVSEEAELIKYAHNGSGYVQIIFFNMMYDLAKRLGVNWSSIEEAIAHDPFVCNRYARPVHKSGRGAGGHCFIKDFAALSKTYATALPEDAVGQKLMTATEEKNIELLKSTKKDLDLLSGVYGD